MLAGDDSNLYTSPVHDTMKVMNILYGVVPSHSPTAPGALKQEKLLITKKNMVKVPVGARNQYMQISRTMSSIQMRSGVVI